LEGHTVLEKSFNHQSGGDQSLYQKDKNLANSYEENFIIPQYILPQSQAPIRLLTQTNTLSEIMAYCYSWLLHLLELTVTFRFAPTDQNNTNQSSTPVEIL